VPSPAAKHVDLWRERRRALKKAIAAFREGHPEGLHDVRVALRRLIATASAAGRKKLSRRARTVVRSLSERRQLEVDRQLLARVRELGLLSSDVAAGLDARWDRLLTSGAREAQKTVNGQRMRGLVKRVERRGGRGNAELTRRLLRERQAIDRRVARLPESGNNHELHRYRVTVKKARYVSEDLALLGTPGAAAAAEKLKAAQEALGRWNDVRMFRRHLRRTRRDAELRGAVTLAVELDRLLAALDGTVEKTRGDALEAARALGNIVPLRRRTA
jgi:CHAD domain-containing protein